MVQQITTCDIIDAVVISLRKREREKKKKDAGVIHGMFKEKYQWP